MNAHRAVPVVDFSSLGIDPFHGGHSTRRAGAVRGAMCHIGQAPQRTRRAEGPHPPDRAIFAASGVARHLKWPALQRDALLTGGKNRPGERGQYQ